MDELKSLLKKTVDFVMEQTFEPSQNQLKMDVHKTGFYSGFADAVAETLKKIEGKKE